ncbi:helitron helicase-like amino-terminal domain protein [Ceratobasidium sp. AG-Ba]|nr:helitron helicase-like amino-terminal domain protein [Ceratobasidium sp. AG-Ba]
MGFKALKEQPAGRGPYLYKIGGEVYHSSNDLIPPHGQSPTYAQIYIYDSHEEAAQLWMQHQANSRCNPQLMRILTGVVHSHHRYADIYKRIGTETGNENTVQVSMVIRQNRHDDPRIYNRPSNDELALIVPDNTLDYQRDIVVRRKDGGFQRIKDAAPGSCSQNPPEFWWKIPANSGSQLPVQVQEWP